MPAWASAGTVSSRCSSDWAAVLNCASFSTMVCPSRVWPQMLMPWYVVGSQVFSSTTIGIPADFPFEARRRHGVVGQFPVVGVLPDRQGHLESEFFYALIGRGHVVEVGDLDVDVLDAGADRVDRHPVDRGDRDRVMALVDPQESDLELESADGFVDEVGEPSVEHGVVISAHLMRLGGCDGDMADAGLSGDESAARRHVQRRARRYGDG